MCAGRREDMKSTARTSNTKAKTKKTTSKSTSMVAVTDDATKLREQIGSSNSSCVNNGGKYSETKKKRAGSKLACLLPWYSRHVWCHSNAIATKKGKPPWHCGASMLTKREREQRRDRSGRTVLALLCVSWRWNFFCQTGAFLRRLGTGNIVQLAFFSVDLDRDLPAEEIAGVEWCSDAFVSLIEELKIVFSVYAGQDCVENIFISPTKNQLRWEPRRSTYLLSPFLYLPLVL